jgi:hypothetical protein
MNKKAKKKGRAGKGSLHQKAKSSFSGEALTVALKDSGIHIAAGIAGGFAGAIIGRPSMLTGLAATVAGTLFKKPFVSIAGVGMMAGGVMMGSKGVNGLSGLDGMKERVKAYADGLKHATYLDKVMQKKAKAPADTGTNGMGYLGSGNAYDFETQYQQVMGLLDEGGAVYASSPYKQVAGLEYADAGSVGDISDMNF